MADGRHDLNDLMKGRVISGLSRVVILNFDILVGSTVHSVAGRLTFCVPAVEPGEHNISVGVADIIW